MTGMDTLDQDAVVGCTDGFRHGFIEGWAWRPNRPHDTVVVQLLVDGVLAGEVTACLPRPDLSTAGIGHGQHAFAIPLVIEPDAPPVLHLTVRAKDGPVLPAGDIEFATSAEDRAELARRRSVEHLEKVFGPLTAGIPQPPRRVAPDAVPQLNFVLYASRGQAASSEVLGTPEYSYVFVMHGFRDLLRRIGVVHVVRHPGEADAIFRNCLDAGQSCLLFSFTPPQNTPLGLQCPTIPVIAWEFGSIPTGGWPGDVREDWRYVLRQTGRAITISRFAARAIRATMGAEYPVAFVPTPVWDRQAELRARLGAPDAPAPGRPVTLEFAGFAWDSRCATLSADMRAPPPPVIAVRKPAPALPMRGAQLALAAASEAEQRRVGEALAQEVARLAAEADAARLAAVAAAEEAARLAAIAAAEQAAEAARAQSQAAEEAAARQAEAMRIAAEQAQRDAEAAVQVSAGTLPPESPKTIGRRLRITAFLARQWYREVVRDALPVPVSQGLSRAGRAVLGGRPGAVPAGAGAPEHDAVAHDAPAEAVPEVAPEIAPEVEPEVAPEVVPKAGPQITPEMGPPADIVPTAETSAAAADPALPPVALYLPVGDPDNPEPEAPPPRYVAAPDLPPLPEPELAVFSPNPYPNSRQDPPVLARAMLDGVVFTAVLSPKDGRKNWQDILTAFATAFRDDPEATLVLKMIGSDTAFWWWEFHDILKALPRFACRVVVISGFLDEANYAALIGATHFVVNASLAEGQCLPLVEFMSAGRPAIAPRHTAMLDYITADNALVVASAVEFCSFPHDPRNMLTTTRYRIEWPSLCETFSDAADIVRTDPARYAAMAAAAANSVQAYCSDAAVGQALAGFLGLGDEVLAKVGWPPLARAEAEPLLSPMRNMQPGAAGGVS